MTNTAQTNASDDQLYFYILTNGDEIRHALTHKKIIELGNTIQPSRFRGDFDVFKNGAHHAYLFGSISDAFSHLAERFAEKLAVRAESANDANLKKLALDSLYALAKINTIPLD